MPLVRRTLCLAALISLSIVSVGRCADDATTRLAGQLRPFLAVVAGQEASFSLTGNVDVPIHGQMQTIAVGLRRFDDRSFDLDLDFGLDLGREHHDYCVRVRRRADVTAMALPRHNVVFLGRGAVDPADHLAPTGIVRRLVGKGSMLSAYTPLATQADPAAAAALLTTLLKAAYDPTQKRWTVGKNAMFRFAETGTSLDLTIDRTRVHLELSKPEPAGEADAWPGMKVVELDRIELERQLARGVRRALEVLAPSPLLTAPDQTEKNVENGQLRWIDGQRVCLLWGSPEQIGRAHGQLLDAEARRCVDSVLYTFGTVQTIRTGRWFRHDLEAAYQRLAPHVPERHKRETRALAAALDLDARLMETLNVFPELFHCSGFAVFGSATTDGKLYHGRVLDYMTAIGLQDAATTFIVSADGKIPFANVGYASFIGSVSGMNARGISLGEMGGRGEGRWDGVPMATLMRRALEECATLDEVTRLWKTSPRTCEYYYVFADGKTNQAVGVTAVPEAVEFVQPGQSHPLLGEGIDDAVVLSSGSRLAKLRERITSRHGRIDVETAIWLMSRPVAMATNLHNVLFVPEDGVFYVANADHQRCAAERPYVRYDLHQLLESMPAADKRQTAAGKR